MGPDRTDYSSGEDVDRAATFTQDMTTTPPTSETQWQVSAQQVDNCSFAYWYPLFWNVKRDWSTSGHITIRSTVIALPEECVDYLNEDGVHLPTNSTSTAGDTDDEVDEESGWSDSDDGKEPEAEERARSSRFPLLVAEIENAISELGGAVMPKLNWSSPRDATWMTGSLRCTNAEDVFLLLKSSDFIAHDLCHAYENTYSFADGRESSKQRPDQFCLVLRKWSSLKPSMEFRCFVKSKQLVAISQRDCSAHYEFLEGLSERIRDCIQAFFETHIFDHFPDPDYVFDVYIDKSFKVWLLDFNVFASKTDSLLFSWEEIISLVNNFSPSDDSNDACEIRFVSSETTVKPNPLHSLRVPTDFIDSVVVNGIDDFIDKCRSGGFD